MTGGRFQTSRYAFKVGMNYVYVRKYNPNGACLKVPNTYLHYISYSALRRKIILMYLVYELGILFLNILRTNHFVSLLILM